LACLLIVVFFTAGVFASPAQKADQKLALHQEMKVQVPFVANEGQVSDKTVKYYARTFGGNFYVRENGEMVYIVSSQPEKKDKKGLRKPDGSGEVKTTSIKETLVDARKTSVEAKDPALTKVNSFIGNDRSKWKTNMATYGSVSVGEVYDGITLSLKACGSTVEKIFTVNPGADPKLIRLAMAGASSLKVNEQGELEVETGPGVVRFSKPAAYQERDGVRKDVRVAYVVDGNTYGFRAAENDGTLPLVIDPKFSYSTYLGGSGYEQGRGIAVDGLGNAYVTGYTLSDDFPTQDPYQSVYEGNEDAFVAKLDSSGALAYSTYLGGTNWDEGLGIAVDGDGNAYVTGLTYSSDFPNLYPFQATIGGSEDAFVTKFDSSGGLVYSTFLGGAAQDVGMGIAVDVLDNAYVTGFTLSSNFPTLHQVPGTKGTMQDAFVTKLHLDQGVGHVVLDYSTYLGGGGPDDGLGIAVDASGDAYVTGWTQSTDFPTKNPYQATYGGPDQDAFVTKLTWSGVDPTLSLDYSTYLGGSSFEEGRGIAVDEGGNAYVTGSTSSAVGFPVQSAYQSTQKGADDAFVTKFDSSGGLVYSTYLGGSASEEGYGIAVDGLGNAYVTGRTRSTDFPTQDPYQADCRGIEDAFVTKLNPSGTALVYSTYLGGSDTEEGYGIAVDAGGNLYVTGYTYSTDFPTRLDSFQPHFTGAVDTYHAFIVKLSPGEPDFTPPAFTLISPTDGQVNVSFPLTIQVQITDPSGVYVNLGNCQPNCYTDPWSVILRLGNFYLNPISWDPISNTLTFLDNSANPMAQPGHCYSGKVEAHDLLKNPGSLSFSFRMADPSNPDPTFGATDEVYPCTVPVFGSRQVCLKDSDLDGIPDDGVHQTDGTVAPANQQRPYGNEATLYTTTQNYLTADVNKRTLFIRPIKLINNQKEFWQEFVDIHLPFVKVPFEHRGIELKVIDMVFNPYTAETPDENNKPPVSIVEITYDLTTPAQSTSFSTMSKQWYWGQLGLTPYETEPCDNKTKYGYFRTTIYGNSIEAYINDRQYPALQVGQQPASLTGPFTGQTGSSPMNFGNDLTVEFNPFVFAGQIAGVSPGTILTAPTGPATPFTENQVIERVIAHEIGHTLLNASVGDHCSDPNCIMYGSLSSATGWAMGEFGIKGCPHAPGKIYDVTPRVHNALNPQYLPPNPYPCQQ
jgi:hypothetical protein